MLHLVQDLDTVVFELKNNSSALLYCGMPTFGIRPSGS